MAALRTALQGSLATLISQTDTKRARDLKKHKGDPHPLPPLDPASLTASVAALWTASGAAETATTEASSSKSKDVLRSVLDLVGRDVALRPIVAGALVEPLEDAPAAEKAKFQTQMQDRLDTVLTLYEVAAASVPDAPALEPGAVFIPLLEELTELLSVATWHELFGFVETRAPRFTRNMPASKGKALPLLRTINAFQRLLSHTPQDLKLRGRVQLFASSAIGIADKSAINMRGEYAAITTTWEEDEEEESKDAEGDTNMDGSGTASERPLDFYSTLWSLQKYFAHPPSLDGPATGDAGQTPFEQFRAKSDFVLSRLYEQTKRERVLLGKNPDRATRKRTRESADLSYPRYLTARNLLDYELADQQFRRQVLVQYFILFQFLLNLTPASANKQQFTGGMPKSFIVDSENQGWITSTIQAIRDELRNMAPDGARFEETLVQLMQRERRYAQWKNEGCPETEWEVAPLDPDLGRATAEKWKRQCRPMRRWPYKLGTPALTRVWESGYKSMDDLKRVPATKTVFELDDELRRIEMDEEDDKVMGREPPAEYAQQKRTIRWTAIREARRTHPRVVAQMKDYDLHVLVANIRAADERDARLRERAALGASGEGSGDGGAEGEGEGDGEGEVEAAVEEAGGDDAGDGEGDAEGEGEGDAEEAADDGDDSDSMAYSPTSDLNGDDVPMGDAGDAEAEEEHPVLEFEIVVDEIAPNGAEAYEQPQEEQPAAAAAPEPEAAAPEDEDLGEAE